MNQILEFAPAAGRSERPAVDAPAALQPAALRVATPDDGPGILALIATHLEEGHLLPRTLSDITTHAHRFVVADRGGAVVGCAELAPLGADLAEVRSLVVDASERGSGLGRALVAALWHRAAEVGFRRLCAFSHAPGWFVHMGFSLVPHVWLTEKVLADCVRCPLFRACGQYAVVASLDDPTGPAVRGASRPS
ncbi:MAG: GNAT family N-acetyltransferase [Acidobacteriota bacterium]|nr:GNAT family N-acetyltransferase [Acidobacteriota bacterium]